MSAPGRSRPIRLYLGPAHPCGYLPGRLATQVLIDPSLPMSASLYAELLAHGFRRSGGFVYRPRCRDCAACVSVRVPVERFVLRRWSRRIQRRNADLEVRAAAPALSAEAFDLYVRYQRARHPGGEMGAAEAEEAERFLFSPWSHTVCHEFRHRGRLAMCAIVDQVPDALSAVYTFFEPTMANRSLGLYAILHLIDECRQRRLPWLYLGYWIGASRKMSYKARFQPLEARLGGRWQPFDPPPSAAAEDGPAA